MTKKEMRMLELIEIAGNVVIEEDLALLKELAKH
jgi:hypothetical protein